MKKRVYSILVLFFVSLQLFTSCNNANNEKLPEANALKNAAVDQTRELTTIEFEKDKHEFGDVNQGETLTYAFKYKNTGNADLVIRNVKASCGCTVPKWSKEPLQPQGEGQIEVEFNTTGRHDFQQKTIRIFANIENENQEVRLSFTANIIVPKTKQE